MRGKNSLTPAVLDGVASSQTGEGESTAQPLAALLLYGCGVPIKGKRGTQYPTLIKIRRYE